MRQILPRHGVLVIVVEVDAGLGVVVSRQVGMIPLDAVIQDADDNTFAWKQAKAKIDKIYLVTLAVSGTKHSGLPICTSTATKTFRQRSLM